MERIKEALGKAEGLRRSNAAGDHKRQVGFVKPGMHSRLNGYQSGWYVEPVDVVPEILERNRIVSHTKTDPVHVVFDILRTKIFHAMQERAWTSLAVCSPTQGCGKSNVAVNLAFSMARQDDCRTVLVDLDLRRPTVAETLGLQPPCPLGHYLEDKSPLEDSFVCVDDNLFFGLKTYRIKNSAEMMGHQKVREVLPLVNSNLDPTIVIVDLPPVLTSDDAIAFLSEVDCAILIAEAGKTTAGQIEDSAQQFEGRTELLGVVLNKCREPIEDNYGYGYS